MPSIYRKSVRRKSSETKTGPESSKQLCDGSTVDVLKNLLCKAVSVKIVQLQTSEIEKWRKTAVHDVETNKNVLIQQEPPITKPKEIIAKKRTRSVKSRSQKNNVKSKRDPLHTKSNPERCIARYRDSKGKFLKIKQPYIKLHRIDKLYNKKFAKLLTKECETQPQKTDHIWKIQTVETLKQPELLVSNTSVRDECIEIGKTKDTVFDSHAETPQLNERCKDDETDSSESVYKANHVQRFRKRIRVIESDSTDSTDNDVSSCSRNDISKKTKRRRLKSSKKATEINAPNVIKTPSENENFENGLNEISNSSEKDSNVNENINVSQQSSCLFKNVFIKCEPEDVEQSNEESQYNCLVNNDTEENRTYNSFLNNNIINNTPNDVPSELNADNVTDFCDMLEIKVEDDCFMRDERLTSLDELPIRKRGDLLDSEIPKKSPNVDACLKQKYRIKELRILLMKIRNDVQEDEKYIDEVSSNSLKDSDVNFKQVEKLSRHIPEKEDEITIQQTPRTSKSWPESTSSPRRSANRSSDLCNELNSSVIESSSLKNKSSKASPSKICTESVEGAKSPKELDSRSFISKLDESVGDASCSKPKKSDKNKEDGAYKCIVCDICFQNFSLLQQHLTVHRKKNSQGPSRNTKIVPEEILQTPTSSKSKSPRSNKKNNQGKVKEFVSKKVQKNKKKENTNESTACRICSKVFPSKEDLAAHIFLHTEKELQETLKLAEEKIRKEKEANKTKEVTQPVENTNGIVDNAICSNAGKSQQKQKPDKPSSLTIAVQEVIIDDTEPVLLDKNDSPSVSLPTKQSKKKPNKENSKKPNKENNKKPNKENNKKPNKENSTKPYKICECHNRPGVNKNCLQVEIIFLCNTCRTLFRSVNCLENHYSLPKHEACFQNRSTGKSPQLFCANCGIIFQSVEGVRHHLESHANYAPNSSIDFRCNICQIIFLGIGTHFYIHWAKHEKNTNWVAKEESFLPYSVIRLQPSNASTEGFIGIAEYICFECNNAFPSEDDKKRHICSSVDNIDNNSEWDISNLEDPPISMECMECNIVFTERKEFYKHIRDVHKLYKDFHYIRMQQHMTDASVYICNICKESMDDFELFKNHWLRHCTAKVVITCMHCNSRFTNNLDNFAKHAKIHSTKENEVISCAVTYEKSKLECPQCCVGFNTLSCLHAHHMKHTLIHQSINYLNNDQTTNVNSPVTTSTNLSVAEAIVEECLERPLRRKDRTIEKEGTNSGNGKSNGMLEENEDDSEVELVIDFTKDSDSNAGSSSKQTASNVILETSFIDCGSSSNVNANAVADTLESSYDPTPKLFVHTLDLEQPTNLSENLDNANASSVVEVSNQVSRQPNERKTADNIVSPVLEKTLAPKKQSSPKCKQGFLKVRSLAELTGSAYTCERCSCLFKNEDELNEHVETHHASNQYNVPRKETETNEEFINIDDLVDNIGKRVSNINVKLAPQSMTSVGREESLYKKYIEAPLNSSQNVATENKLETFNNARKITTAYHKNLPACNIARQSKAMSRTAAKAGSSRTYTEITNPDSQVNSFVYIMDRKDNQYKHTCKFCGFSSTNIAKCMMHRLPGTAASCKKQFQNRSENLVPDKATNNSKPMNIQTNAGSFEPLQPTVCQENIGHTYASHYYPRSCNSSSNGDQVLKQNQVIGTQSIRSTSGGMAIVVNQNNHLLPTSTAQNMSTIKIMQPPVHQQQAYGQPIAIMKGPYNVQTPSQIPNLCEVRRNQFEGKTVTTFNFKLQPTVFICSSCNKSFKSKDHLIMHVNSKHNLT